MRDVVLAIDQGTTNTKAILVDPATGRVLVTASRGVSIAFPAPGWVEQDAEQLWAATLEAVEECLAAAAVRGPRGDRAGQPARVGGGLEPSER